LDISPSLYERVDTMWPQLAPFFASVKKSSQAALPESTQ
jgi:hypothetical protein